MNDATQGRFGLYISIINRAAQGFFYHRLKEYTIGPGQQAYLLSLLPDELIIQDELARRMQVDKANVTRALRSLENQGYITRSKSYEDGRAWNIALTPEGIEIRTSIEAIAKEWLDHLKKPLSTEEWASLEDSLQRIAASLEDGR